MGMIATGPHNRSLSLWIRSFWPQGPCGHFLYVHGIVPFFVPFLDRKLWLPSSEPKSFKMPLW